MLHEPGNSTILSSSLIRLRALIFAGRVVRSRTPSLPVSKPRRSIASRNRGAVLRPEDAHLGRPFVGQALAAIKDPQGEGSGRGIGERDRGEGSGRGFAHLPSRLELVAVRDFDFAHFGLGLRRFEDTSCSLQSADTAARAGRRCKRVSCPRLWAVCEHSRSSSVPTTSTPPPQSATAG